MSYGLRFILLNKLVGQNKKWSRTIRVLPYVFFGNSGFLRRGRVCGAHPCPRLIFINKSVIRLAAWMLIPKSLIALRIRKHDQEPVKLSHVGMIRVLGKNKKLYGDPYGFVKISAKNKKKSLRSPLMIFGKKFFSDCPP